MSVSFQTLITMTVVDWIDVFIRHNHKDAVVESLKYCIENKE
ncbi:MAG: putative transposase [Patiriisocius sp.]|jgi:putative transposase